MTGWSENRRTNWMAVCHFVNMGKLLPFGAYPSGVQMGVPGRFRRKPINAVPFKSLSAFGVRRFIAAFLAFDDRRETISSLPRKAAMNRRTPKRAGHRVASADDTAGKPARYTVRC